MKGFLFFCLMKKITIVFILFCVKSFGQVEGQSFCDGTKDGSYFPLNIQVKKLFWYTTYYFETKKNVKLINGKEYVGFEQQWKDNNVDELFLREENGKVFQYDEETKTEFVRFDETFKVGQIWKQREAEYELIAFDGELKTPYCKYKGLLVIEARFTKVTNRFYYLKGLGYIGATRDGKLISCITPEM
jgi:hypothetical protein